MSRGNRDGFRCNAHPGHSERATTLPAFPECDAETFAAPSPVPRRGSHGLSLTHWKANPPATMIASPHDHPRQRGIFDGEYSNISKKHNDISIMVCMILVIGLAPDAKGRVDREGPRRQATIARPFAVGKYEVTFAEWNACVANGGCGGHRPLDWYWGRGRRPVTNVSSRDARACLRWPKQRTGKSYRLLS